MPVGMDRSRPTCGVSSRSSAQLLGEVGVEAGGTPQEVLRMSQSADGLRRAASSDSVRSFPCARIVVVPPCRSCSRWMMRILMPPFQAGEDPPKTRKRRAVLVARRSHAGPQSRRARRWTASAVWRRCRTPPARHQGAQFGGDAGSGQAGDVAQQVERVRTQITDDACLTSDFGFVRQPACLWPVSSRWRCGPPRHVLDGDEPDCPELAVADQPGRRAATMA